MTWTWSTRETIIKVIMEHTEREQGRFRRRITFNVSGTTFETWADTVERFPTTMLGNPNQLWQHLCMETQRYYFDRNRFAFEAILFFYQSYGKLIRPPELTVEEFENECIYYGIPEKYINSMKQNEGVPEKGKEVPVAQPCTFREKLWLILDQPESSTKSFAYGIVSVSILTLWCAFCCAQTLFSEELPKGWWFYADLVFTSFFSLEYCLRFASTTEFVKFIKKPLNMIDFYTSLPYFAFSFNHSHASLVMMRLMRQLRLLRLIRFLKVFSSSQRMKLLKNIMASSLNDFGLLMLCLLIVVIIGGSLLYFVEAGTAGTLFTSVPESMWWALQTVVVLGYGDIIPKSDTGKIIAAFFMIFGALTISLPVLSVVTKLVSFYGRGEAERRF